MLLLADGADAFAASVSDYQAVRKIALALSVIGFLVALVRMSTSESPSERHRAEGLLTLMIAAFVALIGDRMIVHGIAGWFHLSTSALPAFWQ